MFQKKKKKENADEGDSHRTPTFTSWISSGPVGKRDKGRGT